MHERSGERSAAVADTGADRAQVGRNTCEVHPPRSKAEDSEFAIGTCATLDRPQPVSTFVFTNCGCFCLKTDRQPKGGGVGVSTWGSCRLPRGGTDALQRRSNCRISRAEDAKMLAGGGEDASPAAAPAPCSVAPRIRQCNHTVTNYETHRHEHKT